MKKIIFIFITSIVLGCTSENSNSTSFDTSKIEGKWRLAEILAFDPDSPVGITDNSILELKSDGTFTSTRNPDYPNGTFSVSNDSIATFNYAGNSVSNPAFVNMQKIRIYSDIKLILDNDLSVSGSACAEGCALRYEKVSTP